MKSIHTYQRNVNCQYYDREWCVSGLQYIASQTQYYSVPAAHTPADILFLRWDVLSVSRCGGRVVRHTAMAHTRECASENVSVLRVTRDIYHSQILSTSTSQDQIMPSRPPVLGLPLQPGRTTRASASFKTAVLKSRGSIVQRNPKSRTETYDRLPLASSAASASSSLANESSKSQ